MPTIKGQIAMDTGREPAVLARGSWRSSWCGDSAPPPRRRRKVRGVVHCCKALFGRLVRLPSGARRDTRSRRCATLPRDRPTTTAGVFADDSIVRRASSLKTSPDCVTNAVKRASRALLTLVCVIVENRRWRMRTESPTEELYKKR